MNKANILFYAVFPNIILGAAEASSESMKFLLTKHGTGNALGLVVGGALEALEALEAFPGKFNLKLAQKKGFIKMALTTG